MKKAFFLVVTAIALRQQAFQQTINWQWNNLNPVPMAVYTQAIMQHQGIVGMDALFPEMSRIGMEPVSTESLGSRPTHRPIDGFKRSHTGILAELFKMVPGIIQDDDDICLYIYPNPGDQLFEDYLKTGKTGQKNVEGEIDVNTAFAASIFRYGPKLFSQMTGFGPWVHEKHNYWDTHPHDYLEVHPCENMWWSELAGGKLKYTVGVFSDNSGRFNKWRPNPVIALNAIAFEYQGGNLALNYTMDVPTSLRMVPYPLFDDHATRHYLLDGKDTILMVKEFNTPNIFFSIDFASVSKTPLANGKFVYKGFMKIHSAVKDGGHCIYTVQENTGGIGSRSLSDITVNLESIRCIMEDDDGDTEEIYGAYGVSAVTGMAPVHANVFTPGTSNGTLWSRNKTSTLNLKKGQMSTINGTRSFELPGTGELVIYGDLSEEDEKEGGDNDRLGESYLERFAVKDLQTATPKVITHMYKSGGSLIEVRLTITKKEKRVFLPTDVIKMN